MDEDNELHKPYLKLKTITDQQEQNFLIEVFSSHWKLKFKGIPIFPVSNFHFTQMKDFRRAAGPNAALLIEHYFSMKDEWFSKQAYSLDCLIKNVNKVNASFSQHQHARSQANMLAPSINPMFCESCWKELHITVPLDFDFNKAVRCEECRDRDRPFKRVTRAERLAANIKFGQIVIDIKEDDSEREANTKRTESDL